MDSDTDRLVAREVDGVLTELRTKNKKLAEEKQTLKNAFVFVLLCFILYVAISLGADDTAPKRWSW